MKKGDFVWIIVNAYGNYWNGKKFIMFPDKARKYLTYGKAFRGLTIAKLVTTYNSNKSRIKIRKLNLAIIEEFEPEDD